MSPPIGLLYLTSVLKKSGHQVIVIDARFKHVDRGWITDKLRGFGAEYVGLSAMISEKDSFHDLTRSLKQLPGVEAVIAGGPYPTVLPGWVMEDDNVDALVLGEGEIVLPRLIADMEKIKRTAKNDIPGTIVRSGKELVFGGDRELISDLDQLPFPSWESVDLDWYRRFKRVGCPPRGRYVTMITSRGCPYGCKFCHNLFGKKVRARSPENVVEEIILGRDRFRANEIEIMDDIFNFDRERVLRICELLQRKKAGMKINFPNGLRGDLLDEEQLIQMRKAGTYWIIFGVETASPRLQKSLGKNVDFERLEAAVKTCRRLGIITHGTFILGFPTETREEMEKTIAASTRMGFDFASFFQLIPFPGSKLESELSGSGKENKLLLGKLDYYGKEVNVSGIPHQELLSYRRRAYLRFYLRRILRILFRGHWRKVAVGYGLGQFWHRAIH